MDDRHIGVWEIAIARGYGLFQYVASEGEAESMRAHKASWELAVGRKRRLRNATLKQIREHGINGPFNPNHAGL